MAKRLTVTEAALIIGCERSTVVLWIHRGRFLSASRPHATGRWTILASEVQRVARQHKA